MPFESDKVMFEVYKEATYSGKYRVVYFTELQDHNKEAEINRAMAGEHFFDGFIRAYRKDQAKETIEKLLNRLNEGEAITRADFKRELKPFTPT
jgi:leucyl aminopeptidase (aminopeptidase T)